MTDTDVRPAGARGSERPHPLDPATAKEYLAGREILAGAGLLPDTARFGYYGLAEPTGFFDRNPALDVPPPPGGHC